MTISVTLRRERIITCFKSYGPVNEKTKQELLISQNFFSGIHEMLLLLKSLLLY